MLKSILLRLPTSADGDSSSTLGVLYVPGARPFSTLELPWKNNLRGISCIPQGLYPCRRVADRKTLGGSFIADTFEVTGVPNRSGVLFHVGNYPKDTMGCILVGSYHNGGLLCDSKKGFAEFMDTLARVSEFELSIQKL